MVIDELNGPNPLIKGIDNNGGVRCLRGCFCTARSYSLPTLLWNRLKSLKNKTMRSGSHKPRFIRSKSVMHERLRESTVYSRVTFSRSLSIQVPLTRRLFLLSQIGFLCFHQKRKHLFSKDLSLQKKWIQRPERHGTKILVVESSKLLFSNLVVGRWNSLSRIGVLLPIESRNVFMWCGC